MDFASKFGPEFGFARLLLQAIFVSLLGIALLIGFIVLRRWYRSRYFHRLNEHTLRIRARWSDILTGRIPAKSWRLSRLYSEIVENILLDSIESATSEELPRYLACLRNSGLLDCRIHQARSARGWKRRAALIALGRMRAPEVIPALAEGLEAHDEETRLASTRGLGRTGLPDAALPILDHLLETFNIPRHAVKNALASCCRDSPQLLVRYLKRSSGATRELLARVLGELATVDLGEDLLLLSRCGCRGACIIGTRTRSCETLLRFASAFGDDQRQRMVCASPGRGRTGVDSAQRAHPPARARALRFQPLCTPSSRLGAGQRWSESR